MPETTKCPNPQCGVVLRGGENFCANCGTPLTAAPAVRGAIEQGGTTVTGTSKASINVFPTDKGGRRTPIVPAPKLTTKEMEELGKQLLRNLSDPDVAKRVDAAEEQAEKEMREAASKLLGSRR